MQSTTQVNKLKILSQKYKNFDLYRGIFRNLIEKILQDLDLQEFVTKIYIGKVSGLSKEPLTYPDAYILDIYTNVPNRPNGSGVCIGNRIYRKVLSNIYGMKAGFDNPMSQTIHQYVASFEHVKRDLETTNNNDKIKKEISNV